jgi:hypothetical protein
MQPQFQTKDLYLASYLYAKNAKFIGIERHSKQCYFLFGSKSYCEDLQQEYFAKTGQVVGKEFADAIRTLKDLLFEN